MADPGQMDQILLNLATNARDAMPEGGTLTSRTANVELKTREACPSREVDPGRYVMITVRDTGCGMDESTRRGSSSRSSRPRAGQGDRPGLSTVYGIVKQSQGHLRGRERTGEGHDVPPLPAAPGGGGEKRATPPSAHDCPRAPRPSSGRGRGRPAEAAFARPAPGRVRGARGGLGEEALRLAEVHRKSARPAVTDVVMPR